MSFCYCLLILLCIYVLYICSHFIGIGRENCLEMSETHENFYFTEKQNNILQIIVMVTSLYKPIYMIRDFFLLFFISKPISTRGQGEDFLQCIMISKGSPG